MPGVISRVSDQSSVSPDTIASGDMFLVDNGQQANSLIRWNGNSFEEFPPSLGWICYVQGPPEEILVWNGLNWDEIEATNEFFSFVSFVPSLDGVPDYDEQLGVINTYADETTNTIYIVASTGVSVLEALPYKLFKCTTDDLFFYYNEATLGWVQLDIEADLSNYVTFSDLSDAVGDLNNQIGGIDLSQFINANQLLLVNSFMVGTSHAVNKIVPTNDMAFLDIDAKYGNVAYVDMSLIGVDLPDSGMTIRFRATNNEDIYRGGYPIQDTAFSLYIIFTDTDALFNTYIRDRIHWNSNIYWAYGQNPQYALTSRYERRFVISAVSPDLGATWYAQFQGQFEPAR